MLEILVYTDILMGCKEDLLTSSTSFSLFLTLSLKASISANNKTICTVKSPTFSSKAFLET